MKTIEKFPQTKADFKTTEKDQALTTKNMNDLFFDVIIEQIQALETAHWEHFLNNEASFLPMHLTLNSSNSFAKLFSNNHKNNFSSKLLKSKI